MTDPLDELRLQFNPVTEKLVYVEYADGVRLVPARRCRNCGDAMVLRYYARGTAKIRQWRCTKCRSKQDKQRAKRKKYPSRYQNIDALPVTVWPPLAEIMRTDVGLQYITGALAPPVL